MSSSNEISESSDDEISVCSDDAVCEFFTALSSSERRASLPDLTRSCNLPAVKEPRTTRHRRVTFSNSTDICAGVKNTVALAWSKRLSLSSSKEVCGMITPTEVDKKDTMLSSAPKFTISLSRASSSSSLSSATNLHAVAEHRRCSLPDLNNNLSLNKCSSSFPKEVCDMITPTVVDKKDTILRSGSAFTPFCRSISLSSASNLPAVVEHRNLSWPDVTRILAVEEMRMRPHRRRVSFNLTDNDGGSKSSIAPSLNKRSLSSSKEVCEITPTEVEKKDTILKSGSAFTPFCRSISLSSASNLPAVVEHPSLSWPEVTRILAVEEMRTRPHRRRVSFNLTDNDGGFKNTFNAPRYNHISSKGNDMFTPKLIKEEVSKHVKGDLELAGRLNSKNDYYFSDDKVSSNHPSHEKKDINLQKAKILLGIPPDSTAMKDKVSDSCNYGGFKIPLTDAKRLVRVDLSQPTAELSPRFTANSRFHDAVQAKSKSFHSRRGSASIYDEEKNSRHSCAATQTKCKPFHCVDNPMRGSVSLHMDKKMNIQQEPKRGLIKIPITDVTRRLIHVDSSQSSTTVTNIQELKMQPRPLRQEWQWSANDPITTNKSHRHALFNGDRNLDGQFIQVDEDGFDVEEVAFPSFEKGDNDSKLTAELDDDEPTLNNDEDTLPNTLDTVDLVAEVKRVWRHVHRYEKKKNVRSR